MLSKFFKKKRAFSDPFPTNFLLKKDYEVNRLTKSIVYYSTDKEKYVTTEICNNMNIYNNYKNKEVYDVEDFFKDLYCENEGVYDIFEDIYNEYIENSKEIVYEKTYLNNIEEQDEMYDFDKVYDFDSISYMDDDLYSIIHFNKNSY